MQEYVQDHAGHEHVYKAKYAGQEHVYKARGDMSCCTRTLAVLWTGLPKGGPDTSQHRAGIVGELRTKLGR